MVTEECEGGRLEWKFPIKNGEIKKWVWTLNESTLCIVVQTHNQYYQRGKFLMSLRSYLLPHNKIHKAAMYLLVNHKGLFYVRVWKY